MTVWRPASEIRVKALGLAWRGRRLLLTDIHADDGSLKGARPLGGGVEFGESAASAVVREFKEELGIDIAVSGEPLVMENFYVHEGSAGHEILFLFEIALPPDLFGDEDHIEYREDDGVPSIARWYELDDLDRDGGPELYPKGLKARLVAAHRATPGAEG